MGAYRITYDLRHDGRREEKITIVKRCYSGAEAEAKLKVWWQQKNAKYCDKKHNIRERQRYT